MNKLQLDCKHVSYFSVDTINYKSETRYLYRNLLTLNESAVKVKCNAHILHNAFDKSETVD